MRFAHLTLGVLLLVNAAAHAQEISEAAWLGGIDGAVEACAAAFPERATVYRGAVERLVGCHMSASESAAWRARLRDGAATRRQYADGVTGAKRSLSAHAPTRRQQCASLEELRCDPAAKPQSGR